MSLSPAVVKNLTWSEAAQLPTYGFAGYLVGTADPASGTLQRVAGSQLRFETALNMHRTAWQSAPRVAVHSLQYFKALEQYVKIKTYVATLPTVTKTHVWTARVTTMMLRFLQLKS